MEKKTEKGRFEIFNSIKHGVIVTDLHGEILFQNHESKSLLGFDDNEIEGHPVNILILKSQGITIEDLFKGQVPQMSYHGHLRARKKSGESIWLNVDSSILENSDGAPAYHVFTLCTISRAKLTHNGQDKNRTFSQAIFDASIDAMILIDKRGVIESVNRSTCDMFGYDEPDLIGKHVNKLISSVMNLGTAAQILNDLKTSGKSSHSLNKEIHGVRMDGAVFPIELSVAEVKQDGHLMYAGIIRDLTERRNLERRVLNAGNEERVQIGKELHDGLGQMLTGIRMQAEVLHRKLKANGLPGADEVGEISEMVRNADEFTRNLSRNSIQTNIESIELCQSLEDLCRRVTRLTDIKCTFESDLNSDIDKDEIAQNLYRITQESLTNAIKHGKPNNISVNLSSTHSHIVLSVDDDGKGFDQNRSEKPEKGAGLKIMKHRARVLGGVLDINRTDEDHTRVRCIIPKNVELELE